MFKADDRVRETSTTTGTGTYTLLGAPANYQPFSALGANNYLPYLALDASGAGWELGIGRYIAGPDRLERTHVLSSSNADAAVNWAAGTRILRCSLSGILAMPRTLAKSVAGGAGTTTLTQDEMRRTVIEFTGALTGNRIIEVDDTPWSWVIYNNTTGAFSLTVRVAGQTGVVVPQGRRAVLYADGVDVRAGAPAPSSVASLSEFAAGTKMLFQQTAAPVGWTKDTTHNNKALRLINGTVGSGGATAFTTVFGSGKLTGGKTLATGEIPSHGHTVAKRTNPNFGSNVPAASDNSADSSEPSSNTGGGGSHDHTLSLDLQYVDVIIATKD